MSSDVTLAISSGVKLVDREGRILVVDLGTSWAYIAGFVVGLLAFIVGGNGILQLVLAFGSGGGSLLAAAIFLVVSIAFGGILYLLIRYVRKRNAAAPETLRLVVIFDLPAGTLCDGAGASIAPLATTRLRQKITIGSSSPALDVQSSAGPIRLASGNIFAGGIGPLLSALQTKGIPVG
jgi:hypothetical protein